MRLFLRLVSLLFIPAIILGGIRPVVAEVGRPASARNVPEFMAYKRKKVEEGEEQEKTQSSKETKKQESSQKSDVKTKKEKAVKQVKTSKKISTKKKVSNKKKSIKSKKALHKNTKKSTFIPKVYIDKVRYSPGEKIKVSFRASKDYGENAWIGIVPTNIEHGSAEENDLNAISYQYMDKQTKGNMNFSAPTKYGVYDVRMHDNEFGKEVAHVTFEVKESSGSIELNKTKYKTGEAIKVKFTAPTWFAKDAWVGLMRSSVPHNNTKLSEKHDLEKYTIDNRINGVMVFTVYLYNGEYDIRMFDGKDGSEITSVTFTVE